MLRKPKLEQAVEILRNELLARDDVYNGFLASIESAIVDFDVHFTNIHDLSKHILDRIIGDI